MKKQHRIFLAIGIIVLIGIGVSFFLKSRSQTKDIHYHAGFQVYVDGALQDFSDLKYMQLKPCGGVFEHEDDQIEKAHLHDGVGTVVHVHRDGAVWGDLFTNIKWEVPAGKELVGYLNGERKENILTYPILPYDSVVFFSGKIEDMNAKLQARITDDQIKQVEKKSENCGDDKK